MRRALALLAITSVVAIACGDSGSPVTTSATAEQTTTLPPETSTSTTATLGTTTTSRISNNALDALGYPVSNDWVTETVVSGIDSGAGGLALDDAGNFYVGDWGYSGHPGETLWRISPDGSVEAFARADGLNALTMTVIGPDGFIYQSSYSGDKVFRISPDGTAEVHAEGINGPTGIVALEDGTLFVESYDSSVIHRVLPDGTVEDFTRSGEFRGINGLAAGPDGTLYAVDHKDGRLFAIDAEGSVALLHTFPKATSHVAYLDGSLYVTSRLGYVVFRYDLGDGFVEIIAGNGEPGDADGRGPESSFGTPNAIIAAPDGSLYINHGDGTANDPVTIRRISHQP